MTQYSLNPLHKRRMHRTGETVVGTSGAVGTHGQLFYLNDTSDKWYPADASAEATSSGLLGILLGKASVDGKATFLTSGLFRTTGLNKGAAYFISATSGSISSSEPTLEDEVLRVVGWAKSATDLIFDPSEDYYTITTATQPIGTVSTTPTTLTIDQETILVDATSSAITLNLPTAVGNDGSIFNIKKIDSSSNAVTVDADGTETIDGSLTKIITNQYDCMNIQSNGTGWWII